MSDFKSLCIWSIIWSSKGKCLALKKVICTFVRKKKLKKLEKSFEKMNQINCKLLIKLIYYMIYKNYTIKIQ